MNKEELLNKYQELLKEYQEVEISRRNSIEKEKELKEQKDIAEQKIEFEEAKERFEPDTTMSTEDIVKKAKARQESLEKIEKERLDAEKKVGTLENKKRKIRKVAEEYYNKSLQSKLEELNTIKAEKEKEVEERRAKIEEWSHKENRTTEDYMKLGNELKDSIQDLRKIENDIEKETERLNKYGKQEKMGLEIAYKNFINGADRIDNGKFSEINNEKSENNKNLKDIEKSGKALSESIRKMKESMQEQPKINEQPEKEQEVIGEGKAKIAFTKEELESIKNTSKLDKEYNLKNIKPEVKEESNKFNLNEEKQKEIVENNNSVRILYSAKTDKYLITNVNNGEQKIVSRKEIEKIDKSLLEEKLGRDLRNVDTNILQLLLDYDKEYKTTKSSEYVQMLSSFGKSKIERQQEMQENEIDINYNLKGLYDKEEVEFDEYEDKFEKEERQEILEIANNAKDKGTAKVKKGIKVSLLELKDKILSRISKVKLPTSKKKLSLPQTKKQKLREEVKQQEYDKLANKEYMQSLDKQFEEELRKEKNRQFIEKVNVVNPHKKETTTKQKEKIEDREER